jgi:hypothetical protein
MSAQLKHQQHWGTYGTKDGRALVNRYASVLRVRLSRCTNQSCSPRSITRIDIHIVSKEVSDSLGYFVVVVADVIVVGTGHCGVDFCLWVIAEGDY